jgi:hypothetical protein
MNTATDKAYLVGMTIISTCTIWVAWGSDAPIMQFALVVGGLILGHVVTEILNAVEGEGE